MGTLGEKEKQNALNEIRILASIEHPNVISLKESFYDNPSASLCLVMELCDGGDLDKQVQEGVRGQRKFSESKIWQYFLQSILGLKSLHDR